MWVVTDVNVCVCRVHNKELIYLLSVFIVEQSLVGISAVTLVVIYRQIGIHMICHRAIIWKRGHPQNRKHVKIAIK